MRGSTETMKAVRIHGYGGPEVLKFEDTPRPRPGGEDVLIRVQAAAVNPVDWKVRMGFFKGMLMHRLPLTLGWDVSGVVEAPGPEAGDFEPGEDVYARPDIGRDGSYAEYQVVRAREIARKPQSLDHIHAAAVPLAGLTAWQSLFDAAGLAAGQSVLIHGAAGGVGSFAVQFARLRGARVIGTASRRNQEFLRDLGADEAIDYETSRFEDQVREVDVVLDTVGGETQDRSWGALKKGGILVSIVRPPSEEEAGRHGVRAAFVFVQPNAAQLSEIASLIDAGKVRPLVTAVLPLAEAARAHALSQSGHVRGKLVLEVRHEA